MTEQSFTQGPWIQVIDGPDIVICPAGRPGEIANLDTFFNEDAEKNAYLIAAAPDLYIALGDLVMGLYARPDITALCGPDEHQQIQNAVNALNKAIGKSE